MLLVLSSGAGAATTQGGPAGERLYREGIRPDGAPLKAVREGGLSLEGAAAACVNCHRRSGLGSFEGTTAIPPIIGRYLFRDWQVNREDPTLPHPPSFQQKHDAYTDAGLLEVLRTGQAPDGRVLGPLMPRYELDAGTYSALATYLRGLTSRPDPGVSETTLQFATIVTPDADPVARDAMIQVLERFVAVQNQVIAAEVRPLKANREMMYRVTRRWSLHVWTLTGPPQTWERQLDAKLAAEPVFATIAGLGGRTWAPVHRFCERNALPCFLPNVDLPEGGEGDFYSVYWSRGVLLEADLIETAIAASPGRVVQVYRANDIGTAAAASLRKSVAARSGASIDRVLEGPSAPALARALSDIGPDDRVVLWLRPDDLAALPKAVPANGGVYVSGLLGGLENAPLSAAWRAVTKVTYPLDLPEARRVRMAFPLGWFKVQHLPVVAERVQASTYLACQVLAETIGHVLDAFVRDYVLERLEMVAGKRLATGYYPRLSLGPGQRYASKGGYLVHFADPEGTRLAADTPWLVP